MVKIGGLGKPVNMDQDFRAVQTIGKLWRTIVKLLSEGFK